MNKEQFENICLKRFGTNGGCGDIEEKVSHAGGLWQWTDGHRLLSCQNGNESESYWYTLDHPKIMYRPDSSCHVWEYPSTESIRNDEYPHNIMVNRRKLLDSLKATFPGLRRTLKAANRVLSFNIGYSELAIKGKGSAQFVQYKTASMHPTLLDLNIDAIYLRDAFEVSSDKDIFISYKNDPLAPIKISTSIGEEFISPIRK